MDYNDADDTAEDMPVPPCPGTALPALADQPVRRCTKGLGHKGACADGTGELLGEDAERLDKLRDRAEAIVRGGATTCDATVKNGFDETVRCDLEGGHALSRGGDWPGTPGVYDHMGRTGTGHPLWWRDTAADAVPSTFFAGNPGGAPLPQREPGAALNCVELSSHGDMCTLVAGHKGYHRGEGGVSWGVGAPPVANSVSDASSWIGRVFGGLGGPALSLKMGPLTPQPVRVRFVGLPHRHTAVDGPLHRHPVHIAEPGGFALVVDRFRDAGHRGSELTRWELFGAAIGAHTVLCYPGELDIVGWLDGS